jgi:hypothetical protein
MPDPKSAAATLYEQRIRELPLPVRLYLSRLILADVRADELRGHLEEIDRSGKSGGNHGAGGGASATPPRSLLELEGLGAELWEGLDAQERVNRLRNEWNHRP